MSGRKVVWCRVAPARDTIAAPGASTRWLRSAAAAALVITVWVQVSAAQGLTEVREASNDERVAWLESQRAYPGTTYLRNPVYAVRALSLARGFSSASAAFPITTWRSLGPFGFLTSGFYGSSPNPDGGRIRTIAIHPTNPSIVYAGAASGGVWRSDNGGATWTPLTDQACSLNTGSIAIDPVDPRIVYVGTGEPAVSNGCGLLRSFDGGTTWAEINGGGVLSPTDGTQTTRAYRLKIDRATAGSQTNTLVLWAGTNGLHRSTNSGTSWSTVLPGFISDLEQDPAADSVFWAVRAGNNELNGLWRSVDRGATWSQVWAASTVARRLALATSPAAPRTLWIAVVGSTSRLDALVRFNSETLVATNVGAVGVYTPSTRLDFGGQSSYNLVLEADPTDSTVVYTGGSRVYRSRDRGATFAIVAYDLHVDWHAFEFAPSDPDVVFGGNDGGIYASYDRANSWVSRNTNIAVSQFYPGVAVHPSIPDVVAGGLQDNSSLWGFGSSFWTMSVPSGDGGFNVWSPTDPNVFWATSYAYGYVARVTRTALTGGTVQQYRGLNGSDRKQFFPPLAIDPNLGSTLYYATYRLWRTTNEGSIWSPISPDLSQGSGNINALAISASDSRVIWAGTTDGNVQRSIDGGLTFTLVSSALPNRVVTDIYADPFDFNRAVVTYSGTGTPHVWMTTDAGVNWTNISNGLPDIPFNAVTGVPGTGRLFAGADIGVYESADNGSTWVRGGAGFPNVRVLDLVYQRQTGNLYATTFGRGIFATQIVGGDAVMRGDVNKDGGVNAFDALLVQQALVGITPATTVNPMPSGDANCNGALDAGDVLAILQFTVGSAGAGLCVGRVQ
ncbi:MAG: hypothetical protein IT353_07540 [Gemmatimonadaceae bacterium]|nr:hypothetical protein [Gemmatimonadaceae bacterium]